MLEFMKSSYYLLLHIYDFPKPMPEWKCRLSGIISFSTVNIFKQFPAKTMRAIIVEEGICMESGRIYNIDNKKQKETTVIIFRTMDINWSWGLKRINLRRKNKRHVRPKYTWGAGSNTVLVRLREVFIVHDIQRNFSAKPKRRGSYWR